MKTEIKSRIRPKYRFIKNQKKLFDLKLLKLKLRLNKNNDTETPNTKEKKLKIKDCGVVQKLIDQLAYPPNHDYDVETMNPKGELKIRIEQILAIKSDFFKKEKFLDIGCNKGFFSLTASKNANYVQSIDIDDRYVKICNMVKQDVMNVKHTSFRNFTSDKQFDSILLGNVHHYLFKECDGWEWIVKLAVLSKGHVVIEGPTSMDCAELEDVFSDEQKKKFTHDNFMKEMNKYFVLESKIDSVLPNRYVMSFKRKKDQIDNKHQLEYLPVHEILKDSQESTVFITEIDEQKYVAKITKTMTLGMKNRINIARLSPISNGILGTIYNGNEFIGWLEEHNPDEICKYKQDQSEIIKKLCKHNIFLSKLGYIDTDFATINFFKNKLKLFDKGLVIPISDIDEKVYAKFENSNKGYFLIHLENSFDIIPNAEKNRLCDALATKNSVAIENAFKELDMFIT